MTRNYKIVLSAVLTLIIVPVIFIGFYAVRAEQYARSFSQIETGQRRETAVDLMGNASEIKSCNFPVYDSNKNYTADCFQTFVYKTPFEKWGFAFDTDGKVIAKYNWFLGEYGTQLPN